MPDFTYGTEHSDTDMWADEDGCVHGGPVTGGAQVLDEIREFLGRFVAYPSEYARTAHTLWIAHTWFMNCWDSTPRVAFLSPEPGSGKSRALEITEPLVPRPVHAVNTTPAYLFRKVSDEAGPPTILYDEIDTVFGPKAKDNEDIRGMLNAGHRSGATAGRCVMRGKIVETEELPAYCAVAFAGLDDLPDTIMSRCVVVRMRRRAADEAVEPWRSRLNRPDAVKLRDRLAEWATASAERIRWPKIPSKITDRDADVWEALLAVADLAGGHWPATARAAAVTLVTQAQHRPPSIGVLLLRDLGKVFDALGDDRARTETLLTGLNDMPEAPWATIRRGEPLDSRGLTSRLGKYGIASKAQRVGPGTHDVFKGYSRAQFEDAWKRYVAPLPADDADAGPTEADSPVTSVTGETSQVSNGVAVTGVGGSVTADRLHGYNYHSEKQAPTSGDTAVTDVTAKRGYTGPAEPAATCPDCGQGLLFPGSVERGRCERCHLAGVSA